MFYVSNLNFIFGHGGTSEDVPFPTSDSSYGFLVLRRTCDKPRSMENVYRRDGPDLNHYQVLGLKVGTYLTAKELKSAYHQALLLHHPDKTPRKSEKGIHENGTDPGAEGEMKSFSDQHGIDRISVDRISLAYQTLSESGSKAEYDRLLLLSAKAAQKGNGLLEKAHQHPGVDVIDLEDMDCEGDWGIWRRACRCGDRRAYEVTEVDLEREQSHGEIYVGCKGCSLFIKVLFHALDDHEQDGSGGT